MWRAVLTAVGAWVLASTAGCAGTASYRDIRPACRAPAPLEGQFDPYAPDFWIELRPAADVTAVADELVVRYGIHPRFSRPGGSDVITVGTMSPETVAALRCDPAVKTISHDAVLEHVTLESHER